MIKRCLAMLFSCLLIACSATTSKVAGKSPAYFFGDSPESTLVTAIGQGDFVAADKALKSGGDVNKMGAEGISPLLWVMGTTLNARKIEYLLKAGANPNYRSGPWLVSPMYLAAGGNRLDILELLLKNRGDPDLAGRLGETLLMVAVTEFRDEHVGLLMRYGADISRTDDSGDCVATTAARIGRFDQVAFFLEQGLKYDMQRLARTVDVRVVPEKSEQQRWKDKVIEMLKGRGATFPTSPAFVQKTRPAE